MLVEKQSMKDKLTST